MIKLIQFATNYFQLGKREFQILFSIFCFIVLLYIATDAISSSPDYGDYKYDYLDNSSRFEIGYRSIVWLARFLGADFDSFAYMWITINCILLICCYRSIAALIISMPTLIYLSQSFIGTQLRYSMAITIIVLAVSIFGNRIHMARAISAIVAVSIHVGVIVLSGIILSMPFTLKVAAKRKIVFLFLCISAISLTLLLSIFWIDQIFLLFSRNYYINSIYEERKSIISILYETIMAALCVVVFLRRNAGDYYEMIVGIQVISVALAFSGVAVIGGRYLHVFWLLEPLIASRAISVGQSQRDPVIVLCGVAIALLSMSKLLTADVHIPHLF